MINQRHIKHLDEYALKAKCIDFLIQEHGDYNISENYVIINELKFQDGKRRADLVEVNGRLNAYEIKSDLDNLDKLECQLLDYKGCFDTVTVVTTQRHLNAVKENVPIAVGILLISEHKATFIRRPKEYKKFNNLALITLLSRHQLDDYTKSFNIKSRSRMSTTEKRITLSKLIKTSDLKIEVSKNLKKSYASKFIRFLKNRSPRTMADEIGLFCPGYIVIE